MSSVKSFRVLTSFSWGNSKPVTLSLKGREILPLFSGDNVTMRGTIIKCNDGNKAHFTGKILVPLKSKTARPFQRWNDFILKTKTKTSKKNSLPTQPQAEAVRGCTGWVPAAAPAAAEAEHRGGRCGRGCAAAASSQATSSCDRWSCTLEVPLGWKQKSYGFKVLQFIFTAVKGSAAVHSEQMQNLQTVSFRFIPRFTTY